MPDLRAYLSALQGQLGAKTLGALPAGSTSDTIVERTYSGHSGGTTDFRAWVEKNTYAGGNSAAQVIGRNGAMEFTHSGGTVTFAYYTQAFIRLGRLGSSTGNITTARIWEGHIANEGSGTIAEATVFMAQDVDLLDGTGAIGNIRSFYSGNIGHASRITGTAIGYDQADITGGAAQTIGYRSQVSDGTNKYNLFVAGSAPNLIFSNTRIGDTTRPQNALEVKGYFKAANLGTFLASGSYHELRQSQNTFALRVSNGHGSSPRGVQITFDAFSPNNTSETFLTCTDTVGDAARIYSSGNGVNRNNSWGGISDRKFKHHIVDARSQVDDFRKLRFRRYRLKYEGDDGKEYLGLIAQEALKVSPGLVNKAANDDGSTHYELAYSILYMKAAVALQETIFVVDDHENRIGQIERTLAA
ncbi:tail fiber domain-containing protein [Sphingobium phenoxybenzoativorans]|uniref:Tail fiber domain-containing protein n=1 Tax=Sphingobium phenoxybenzoativorans TaxID=1592790 RepID=A0A975K4V0_9SPHN|nr:tail fiber domain-containing protein [Sphingobium phenoxybenzoativorans]QUT04850.1 tail fiber domain-containing protein [Sphingobium phenoxybenzoativorans]